MAFLPLAPVAEEDSGEVDNNRRGPLDHLVAVARDRASTGAGWFSPALAID